MNNPITYENGTYRTQALDYRLKKDSKGNAYIEHRKHNSQWWDIAYGDACHTQEVWNNIKREGKLI
jgi:hypothetical protein